MVVRMQVCIIVQYPYLLQASCERLVLLRTESSGRSSPSQLICLLRTGFGLCNKDDSVDGQRRQSGRRVACCDEEVVRRAAGVMHDGCFRALLPREWIEAAVHNPRKKIAGMDGPLASGGWRRYVHRLLEPRWRSSQEVPG